MMRGDCYGFGNGDGTSLAPGDHDGACATQPTESSSGTSAEWMYRGGGLAPGAGSTDGWGAGEKGSDGYGGGYAGAPGSLSGEGFGYGR